MRNENSGYITGLFKNELFVLKIKEQAYKCVFIYGKPSNGACKNKPFELSRS